MSSLSEKIKTGSIVTLIMILSGTILIDNLDQTYYCSTEDSVKECISVSGSRCYLETGWDTCVDGTWEPVGNYMAQEITDPGFVIYKEDILMSDGGTFRDYGGKKKICFFDNKLCVDHEEYSNAVDQPLRLEDLEGKTKAYETFVIKPEGEYELCLKS